jgi:hypothetical protein
MSLDHNARVYARDYSDDPAQCMWFALCDNVANGLRDAGPLGMVPICKRCDDKMNRIEA